MSFSLRPQRQRLVALVLSCLFVNALESHFREPVQAAAVSASARALYDAGLQLKHSNPAKALVDFQSAARLDRTWEAPVYQEGVLLSVHDFKNAVPVLQKAALLNPQDDTVWNILGWGYYMNHDYRLAEAAFHKQLQVKPDSPEGQWGLANCYGNSQVRSFAKARFYLRQLLSTSKYHAAAQKQLTVLPPDDLDASVRPTAPITTEDAIGILLSYRTIVQLGTSSYMALDGQEASASVQPYIAYAAKHGLLSNLPVPSFTAPATRAWIAELLANDYGINAYDYIRPFPLMDLAGVSTENLMKINSLLALGLMSPSSPNHFQPEGTMSRAQFAALVANANRVMKNPPPSQAWNTPSAPQHNTQPVVYDFTTSRPDINTQANDLKASGSKITALGFTAFPLLPDVKSHAAAAIAAKAGTTYLVPTLDSSSPVLSLATAGGVKPFLVLGNYNQNSDQSDPGLVDQLLSNSSTMASLAEEVAKVASTAHMAGVTADFENIWAKDKIAYVEFLSLLKKDLAAESVSGSSGMKLMVCLPEQSSDSFRSAYDYEKLGAVADWVMLITYDEHTPGHSAGAITDIQNEDRVVKYALTKIPAGKLLLGLADYGYDWTGLSGLEVSQSTALLLAKSHHVPITVDPATKGATFAYSDAAGVKHTVWFTNAASAQAQAGLVPKYGLAGVAIWHLGSANAAFWQGLEAGMDAASSS